MGVEDLDQDLGLKLGRQVDERHDGDLFDGAALLCFAV
jgi:hypothetical protein